MALDIAKFLARFVEEARENVARLNEGLVALEKNPDDTDIINSVFRSAHTIKGSSRMMKLVSITEVAHTIEDALAALRDKKIKHSKEFADLLFSGIDAITHMIEKVSSGQEISTDNSSLCEKLRMASEGNISGSVIGGLKKDDKKEAEVLPLSGPEGMPSAAVHETGIMKTSTISETHKVSETVRVNAEKLDDLIKLMGEIVSSQNRIRQRSSEVKETVKVSKRALDLLAGLDLKGSTQSDAAAEITATVHLLNSKLSQLAMSVRDDNITQEFFRGELQEKALKLRMVPLSGVFDSLHRMVRDIARSVEKNVDFIVHGGDIEIDKKMMEKIFDSIIHMIRNSIDHGIEFPDERLKAGKSENGMITLSACYDSGNVYIELKDDGRGISCDKIREKALSKKLLKEAELDSMSDSELVELIFIPGFSTSAIVTDVSGRGVGMDVVKRNIVEELGGVISTTTEDGKGTTFIIRLPLTLAIVRILLFKVSDVTLALPAHYVREIIRIKESGIITVVDKKAVRLREEIIPVINLKTLLRLPGENKRHPSELLVIIIFMGNTKMGLIVDELLEEADMVIKPLPGHMKNVKLVSGVTISGKNEIINVLHLPAVFEASRDIKETSLLKEPSEKKQRALHILVVDDSVNTRDIEKSILESYGYKVDLANDGMEALEKAGGSKYDVIITDIEMPRLDGFSLTERLRADPVYKDTPIIIVSSREKEEDKRRGIAVGANAYIVKGSFDQSNLLETVQNLAG